jgi:hypothetical protein
MHHAAGVHFWDPNLYPQPRGREPAVEDVSNPGPFKVPRPQQK